jgi:hypothetical protein
LRTRSPGTFDSAVMLVNGVILGTCHQKPVGTRHRPDQIEGFNIALVKYGVKSFKMDFRSMSFLNDEENRVAI